MHRLLGLGAIILGTVVVCASTAAASMTARPNAADAARAASFNGATAGAIAQLEPYVTAHPDDPAAARTLGDLYFRNGDLDRAQTVWLADTKRHPDDRDTHERLGELLAARGHSADAMHEFEQSIPLRGGLLRLVELHRQNGSLKDFVATTYMRAAERPEDPAPLMLYAIVLQGAHRAADALPYYTHVVDMMVSTDDRCYALVSRATDLLELQRRGEAIADLQTCLQSDPNNYGALTVLGSVDLDTGANGQARTLLEHALAVLPDGVEALINLGYLDDLSGNRDQAAQRYEQAITLDPLRPEGYVNLGYDYAEQGDYAQSESVLLSGLVGNPDNGRLHFLLGTTYRSEDKPELANAQFRAALTSDDAQVVTAARAALANQPTSITS